MGVPVCGRRAEIAAIAALDGAGGKDLPGRGGAIAAFAGCRGDCPASPHVTQFGPALATGRA